MFPTAKNHQNLPEISITPPLPILANRRSWVGQTSNIRLKSKDEVEVITRAMDESMPLVVVPSTSCVGLVATIAAAVKVDSVNRCATILGLGRCKVMGIERMRPSLRVNVQPYIDTNGGVDALHNSLQQVCRLFDEGIELNRRKTKRELEAKLDNLGSADSEAILRLSTGDILELRSAAASVGGSGYQSKPIDRVDDPLDWGFSLPESIENVVSSEHLSKWRNSNEYATLFHPHGNESIASFIALRLCTITSSVGEESLFKLAHESRDALSRLDIALGGLRERIAGLRVRLSLLDL